MHQIKGFPLTQDEENSEYWLINALEEVDCLFDRYELYRQEFALFSWYSSGKLTREQYLACLKPIDKAIAELEMATLQSVYISKKASLQHFQKPKH